MHCYNCQTENTPMWRRTLDVQTDTILTLCNACGLYYKTKGKHRPTVLVSKKNSLSTTELLDQLIQSSSPNENKLVVKNLNLKDLNIIHCSNCQNINTSIWRKDKEGRNICNACGLYYKKKGFHRAVRPTKTFAKDKDVFLEIDDNLIRFNRIKRRKRSSVSLNGEESIQLQKPTKERSQSVSSNSSSVSSSVSSSASSVFVEDSPKSTLSLTYPVTPPYVLLPTNYNLISHEPSHGTSIDQYHYDYTSLVRTNSIAQLQVNQNNGEVQPNSRNQVQLPSIRSILHI